MTTLNECVRACRELIAAAVTAAGSIKSQRSLLALIAILVVSTVVFYKPHDEVYLLLPLTVLFALMVVIVGSNDKKPKLLLIYAIFALCVLCLLIPYCTEVLKKNSKDHRKQALLTRVFKELTPGPLQSELAAIVQKSDLRNVESDTELDIVEATLCMQKNEIELAREIIESRIDSREEPLFRTMQAECDARQGRDVHRFTDSLSVDTMDSLSICALRSVVFILVYDVLKSAEKGDLPLLQLRKTQKVLGQLESRLVLHHGYSSEYVDVLNYQIQLLMVLESSPDVITSIESHYHRLVDHVSGLEKRQIFHDLRGRRTRANLQRNLSHYFQGLGFVEKAFQYSQMSVEELNKEVVDSLHGSQYNGVRDDAYEVYYQHALCSLMTQQLKLAKMYVGQCDLWNDSSYDRKMRREILWLVITAEDSHYQSLNVIAEAKDRVRDVFNRYGDLDVIQDSRKLVQFCLECAAEVDGEFREVTQGGNGRRA